MKDARGHGSNVGHSALVTAAGKGILPTKPYRQSKSGSEPRHTDTQRRVFGLRTSLAATQSPGHARVLLQGIKNLLS